jgi:hypothetical protein
MATTRAEEIYEQHIKLLPETEQLCLIELIAHQFTMASTHETQR